MFITQKKYKQSSHRIAVKIRGILGDISKEVQEFFSQIVNFIKLNAVSYFWSKYDKNAKDYLQYSIELDLVLQKVWGLLILLVV